MCLLLGGYTVTLATWSFNSYKGGTGKTNTSLNCAAQLALKGNNVALLDFDFLGPALFAIFGTREETYLNQAFYEGEDFENVFFPYETPDLNKNGGNLLIGLADPRPKIISKMSNYTEDSHREAFGRVMECQEILEDDYGVNFIIIDTGPGLRRDVANAIMISDSVAFVLKPTLADLEGTKLVITHMLEGIQKVELTLVMNRSLDRSWQDHATLESADAEYNIITQELRSFAKNKEIFMLADIPCYCDIARSQSDKIIVLEHPTHPFSVAIDQLAENLIKRSPGD